MITTSEQFHEVALGSVRPLAIGAEFSWDKVRSSTLEWFTLDQSQLDGADILAIEDDPKPIQNWDGYDYTDESSRIISMNYERSVEFPYNVQTAIADIELNNYDGRYSVGNTSSPIEENILPKRPVRLYSGFKKQGTREVVPSFVGLTQKMPSYTGQNDNVAKMTALDFLSDIGNLTLRNTVMLVKARTDEVIRQILGQYGVDPAMIQLGRGLNVIPFVVIESGTSASNTLQKLVQAENGSMWLSETGVIRFEPRTGEVGSPVVYEFDDSNIIDLKTSKTDGIINHVIIKSDIREVQDVQPIFQASNEQGYTSSADQDPYRIGAYGNLEVWFSLDDPAWSSNTLILNGEETDSRFTALDLSGGRVASGIIADGYLFTDSYKVVFSNANSFPVSLDFIELWGEPAKIVDTIDYDAYESDSVERFGEQVLEITDNKFFGSYRNADSYATDILRNRSEYSPVITITVKGNPALQLADKIHVVHNDIEGDYKITSIKNRYSKDGFKSEIRAERYTELDWFTLNKSLLNSTDVLGV